MAAEMFLKPEQWLHGPAFLKQPEETWPKYPENSISLAEDDPEVKKTVAVFGTAATETQDPVIEFIQHFSSWDRLKRATARFLQFKDLLMHLSRKKKAAALTHQQSEVSEKHPKVQTHEHLSVEDLARAEETLLCCVQQRHFQEEISALEAGKISVKKSSKLLKLDPYLCDGVLRVGGRLNRKAMPEEFKHPAILPKDSHLTRLLLRHIHISVGHSGRNQMLQSNSATRRIMKDGIFYKRWHTPPSVQKMSDLPLTPPTRPPSCI